MNNDGRPSSIQPTQPPLAVVGLSALFPKAANSEEFWSNIRLGIDAITEVPDSHWNPDDYFDSNQKTPDMTYARRGGFLSPLPFDPLEFGISPNNLEAIDTSQLLGLVGAKRALEHAGYGAGRTFDRSRVGCILGVTGTLEMVIPLGARLGHPKWRKALKDAGVPEDVAEDVVNRISESYVPWQENSFPGLLGNVVAGRIANRLDLHGTNCVVDAACASSLSAMHLAALELWTGRSDMVVTGGIDTFNDIFMFMCFSKTPALSPSGDAKPFSDDASGTILGEGVGMVVLKRLADAERDGDRIYAVIKGIGTSSDGAGNAVYAPKSEGQVRCLEDAYRVAGVSPDTIELVEAHGTGTKVGDATEVSGLMQVYQAAGRRASGPPKTNWCAVGSVKSQIGHTKAAAGAAGVLKAILALQHKVLPPTIKVSQPPSALMAADSPFYVNTVSRPWVKPVGHPRRAAVSAFGFGGSNFHCVLEESPQSFDEPEWDGDVQVVALSALSLNELAESVRGFCRMGRPASAVDVATARNQNPRADGQECPSYDWPSVRKAAHVSRASFCVEHPHRLVFVIEQDKTDIAKLTEGALSMLDKYADRVAWSTPDGAHYGRGARTGALAVLFPGQGSQYVGMLRELALRFPAMNAVLSEANAVFSSTLNSQPSTLNRLSDYIYPTPSWSDEARVERDSELRATQIAQPAIGAVSLGALAVLEQFGVRAEAAAGHSYGELTALCASRRFAPAALYRLSMLRGRLMAEAQEVDGGMLAIGAPLTQVEAAIKELAVDLVVANYNSPNQVVLSGRLPEIDRATALFTQRNMRGKKLQVAAAFHSPLVASASRAFRPELDGVEFAASQMPVYANTTAAQYPTDARDARDLLAAQLARPVNFVREVEQMYADGVRTFVEVGPGGVLTGLVGSILSGRDFRAVAVDSSSGKRGGLFDLASALAQVSASGHSIDWTQWDPHGSGPADTGSPHRLRIPISGANYVKPRTPIPPRPPMTPSFGMTSTFEPGTEANPSSYASSLGAPSVAFASLNRGHVVPPKSRVLEVDPYNMLNLNEPTHNESPEPRNESLRAAWASPRETDGLALIQENLRALQRMQEETARLHQRFLEGQEAALRTFESLAQRHLELAQESRGIAAPPKLPAVAVAQVVPVIEKPWAWKESDAAVGSGQWAVESKAKAEIVPVPIVAPVPSLVPQPVPLRPAPSSALTSTVLAVVSEKTGYPTEMLNLGMSLDHDLGIDSIKRVEILSALQERVPNLPAFKPEELGALHTLQDVVGLADARMSGVGGVESKPKTEAHTALVVAPAPVISHTPIVAPAAIVAPLPTLNPQPKTISSPALTSTVLAVVSEKTGYPVEMLNLGMSLDHDLGIDSIKRVEILSALQERVPNLPAFKPEELGALHTLQDVVALAEARMGGNRSQESEVRGQAEPLTLFPPAFDSLKSGQGEGAGAETRIATPAPTLTLSPQPSTFNPPRPSLRNSLSLDMLVRSVVRPVELPAAETRALLPLARGAEIWITEDGLELSLRIAAELSDRGFKPRVVNLDEPFLPAVPERVGGLIVVAPADGISDRQLWRAMEWLQKAGPGLRRAATASAAVFATVSRLDGRFGFEAARPLTDPVSGGLAGLTKSAAREWPELTCKAFDLADGWASPSEAARVLVEELLRVGPIEIGLSPKRACTPTVFEERLPDAFSGSAPVRPGELIIVSGGARGVTAAAALAIAHAWQPRLAIIGRSPEPDLEPDWLTGLTTEAEIKQALIARAPVGTVPRAIDSKFKQVLAQREVAVALAQLRATGVPLTYHAVDVRDQATLRPLISQMHREWGPTRGVIHGAGVLADGRIEDKTREQFERVFETKVSGLRHLLGAISPNDLRVLGLFSSYTARFGRVGQSDYAIANEVLNKLSRQFAIERPQTRVVSFNWGPWDGGMVTGGLKHLFASEGVGLIPLAEGAELVVRELSQTEGRPVEVLVIGETDAARKSREQRVQETSAVVQQVAPSAPTLGSSSIYGSSSNINVAGVPASKPAYQVESSNILLAGPSPARPFGKTPTPGTSSSWVFGEIGQVKTPEPDEIKPSFERLLDVVQHPFLESHVIGGKAVLPVAMVVEWLAHGAIHRNPGLELHGFDDLRIFQGVRIDRQTTSMLRVLSAKPSRSDGQFQAKVQLIGMTQHREAVHAGGHAVLSAGYPAAPSPALHVTPRGYPLDVATAYATRLFHGTQLQGIAAIEACSEDGIVVYSRTASAPWAWMKEPLRSTWIADPLALDAALQAIILWSQELRGEPCLPCSIARYRQYRRTFPREGVRIVVQVIQATDHAIRCDVEFLDSAHQVVARMEGCESVADPSLAAAFQRNRLE